MVVRFNIVFKALAVACFSVTGLAAGAAAGGEYQIHPQMHFAQGWDISLLERASAMGATGFRDDVHWHEVETEKGVYDFNVIDHYITAAADAGMTPMLIFAGSNPLYDNDHTPFSDEGRKAFAAFVAATVQAYPEATRRIEVGNEFNTENFLSGPFQDDTGAYFGLLIAEVDAQVSAVAPETEILCTGALSVAIGYYRSVFEAGALEHCDAISLHPYRDVPEYLDRELARLRDLMAEFSREVPIYVTEFGKWFDDPFDAPEYMLKMATLMGSSGVGSAYWYAFKDEPWWPNMGLIDEARRDKPSANTYRLLQQTLLPLGRPVALGTSPLDHVYGFGDGSKAAVAWGAKGRLVVASDGPVQFLNASGAPIPPVTDLKDAPVVILGENLRISVERPAPIYDSLYQFDTRPWSYHVNKGNGDMVDLVYMDWNWTTFLGDQYLRPAAVQVDRLISVSFNDLPYYTIERLTAPTAGRYAIDAVWQDHPDNTGGAVVQIRRNDKVIATREVSGGYLAISDFAVELAAGDRLDFAVGPNRAMELQRLTRRIQITGP